jgi:hypothetical protein
VPSVLINKNPCLIAAFHLDPNHQGALRSTILIQSLMVCLASGIPLGPSPGIVWQPDGDSFVTIIFGLITTFGVLLSALQTFLAWRRA